MSFLCTSEAGIDSKLGFADRADHLRPLMCRHQNHRVLVVPITKICPLVRVRLLSASDIVVFDDQYEIVLSAKRLLSVCTGILDFAWEYAARPKELRPSSEIAAYPVTLEG